jgi:AraC-like DNA-binding protein
MGTVTAVPAVLDALGTDPVQVLAEVGLDLALFADPENRISYTARGRLLARCVARTGCRHFGLLVGQRSGLSSLGLVGYLVQHSADVESALRGLVRNFQFHTQGGLPTLATGPGSAMLGFAIYQPEVEAADQIVDGAIAIEFNVMRELCGPDWKPTAVLFAHRKPDDVRPFRQFFRAPLSFDAEQSALVFPSHWLGRRVAGGDPGLRQLLQAQIDRGRAGDGHADDFPEQVRRVLCEALLSGQSSTEQVAALFGMHGRTLNRRLEASGTSLRELVEEGRYTLARQMLEHSRKDMSEIASVLGYSESSAFTRAFRRWSGRTPHLWRKERRPVSLDGPGEGSRRSR